MKNRFLNNIGYTLIEIALVASLVGVVPVTLYLEAAKEARTVSCISNLRNIYIGMQMYEMDFETIPDAKFYPKLPKDDPQSIINILSNYIDDRKVFICPSMPDDLKKSCLTYIWNDTYNNQPLSAVRNQSSEWLMTEMSAVDPKIPPPHRGSYNILFFDGHADTIKEAVYLTPIPADLKDLTDEDFFANKPNEIGESIQYILFPNERGY